jgi:hypothetical protein
VAQRPAAAEGRSPLAAERYHLRPATPPPPPSSPI